MATVVAEPNVTAWASVSFSTDETKTTVTLNWVKVENWDTGAQRTCTINVTVNGTSWISNHQTTVSNNDTRQLNISVSPKTFARQHFSETIKVVVTCSATPYSSRREYSTTVSARPSYVIYLNSNGAGTSIPAQTKWHGEEMSLPSPTRSGYTFKCWTVSSSGSGTQYTGTLPSSFNQTNTLYAMWNPNIYYYANGSGTTGLPSTQTKEYTASEIRLSSVTPVRDGYKFNGWNTKQDGTGTDYPSGGYYYSNATLSLYAKWLRKPKVPAIGTMTCVRCDSSGTQDDEGSYVKVTLRWRIDVTSDTVPGNVTTYGYVDITPDGGSTTTVDLSSSWTSDGSGNYSAQFVRVLPTLASELVTDTQYTIVARITDEGEGGGSGNTSARQDVLTKSHFLLDFRNGGNSIGIGCTAASTYDGASVDALVSNGTIPGLLHVGYRTVFDERVSCDVLHMNKTGIEIFDSGIATGRTSQGLTFGIASQVAYKFGSYVEIHVKFSPGSGRSVQANTTYEPIQISTSFLPMDDYEGNNNTFWYRVQSSGTSAGKMTLRLWDTSGGTSGQLAVQMRYFLKTLVVS